MCQDIFGAVSGSGPIADQENHENLTGPGKPGKKQENRLGPGKFEISDQDFLTFRKCL